MNPGTAIDELPWRMGTTIDSDDAEFNGSWNLIQIPLQELQEKGAWKDEWFDPAGKFDWTAVDSLEFVTEHKPLGESVIYLDEVMITGSPLP